MATLIRLFAGVLAMAVSTSSAQTVDFLSAMQAGGTGNDRGTAVGGDGSGGFSITGSFQGSGSFGSNDLATNGPLGDIFVARVDNSGNFVWAASAGGIQSDEGLGIAVDQLGNTVVTGYFSGEAAFGDTDLMSNGSVDYFVAKYDPNGNLLWALSDGGQSMDRGQGVAVDADGNVLVTGYFSEEATFGDSTFTSRGQFDIFIVKYDADGNFVWAAQEGDAFFDEGKGIAADPSGNVFATGKFSSFVTFGDTTLSSRRIHNTFLTKYDADGNLLWARKAGGRDDFSYGVATDGLGNSVVTGYFQETGEFNDTTLTSAGSGDIFVAKYDPDGDLLWVNQAGGDQLDQGFGVAADAAGNTVATGFFVGEAVFNDTTMTSMSKDAFFVKYDPDGNLLWAAQGGDEGNEEGYGVASPSQGRRGILESGNAVAVGMFEGPAVFGQTGLVSSGGFDVFVTTIGSGDPTAIERHPGAVPTAFELRQNYPNPFNPTTSITYSLREASEVFLIVYDVLGKEVARLVDNQRRLAGVYTVSWDAAEVAGGRFPSGLYIYQLRTDKNVASRRAVLLK